MHKSVFQNISSRFIPSVLLKLSLFFPLFIMLFLTACGSQLSTAAYLPMRTIPPSEYKATAIVIMEDVTQADSSSTGVERRGKATIVRASDNTEETFGVGDAVVVDVGDVITAWEGKTVITFFDGHTTTLTPVSKIEILSLSRGEEEESISLFQFLGSSANHVNRSASEPVEFDINTESSIAAVRGTDFYVDICGPDQTFYQTFTGSIEVTKEEESVFVDAGFQTLATLGEEFRVLPLPEPPICGDDRAVLEYPLDGQFVFTSTVPVYGTAIHENFDYWKLEYKAMADPSNEYSFLYSSTEPIISDLMASLDVSHLDNGDYTLRLMTVDKTGNYPEPCTIQLYLYPRHDEASGVASEN